MTTKNLQKRMTKMIVPCDKLSEQPFDLTADEYADIIKNRKRCGCVEKNKDKDGKKVITSYWLELCEGYVDMKPLVPFHREVLFTCISFFEQGFDVITYSMILDALTGGGEKRHVSSNQYDAIRDAIDKLMKTAIKIDLSRLFDAMPKYQKNHKGDSAVLAGAILPCKYLETEINGQKTLTLKMLDESPLMTLAKIKKQLIAYENAPLAIAGQNNTPQVMTLKAYLLRRINLIERGMNKSIRFDTIYQQCGIDASRSIKQNARNVILETLEAFKKEGVIKDFEIVREGNKFRSITISPIAIRKTKPKKHTAPKK